MLKRVKILAMLWLFYFIASIGLIGIFAVGMVYFPVLWLTRLFPRLKGLEDRCLRGGVQVLMRAQPWYKSTLIVDLPQPEKERGLLVVSNHRSHLDVFILLTKIPGVRVLAKSSLFKIPFLGAMMRSTRQIGVERGRLDAWTRAMEQVRLRLKAGETVHIFPEMTRCPAGFPSVQPFVAAPFFVAMQEDVTILPLVFKNTDRAWPKDGAGIYFREPVEVRTLAPVRARDFANAESLRTEVHRRIEEALA